MKQHKLLNEANEVQTLFLEKCHVTSMKCIMSVQFNTKNNYADAFSSKEAVQSNSVSSSTPLGTSGVFVQPLNNDTSTISMQLSH